MLTVFDATPYADYLSSGTLHFRRPSASLQRAISSLYVSSDGSSFSTPHGSLKLYAFVRILLLSQRKGACVGPKITKRHEKSGTC